MVLLYLEELLPKPSQRRAEPNYHFLYHHYSESFSVLQSLSNIVYGSDGFTGYKHSADILAK